LIRAVFFDVGETLLSEDGVWGAWADWYGVPRLTLFGVLGAVVERRGHHLDVLRAFDPSFSLEVADGLRARAGKSYALSSADLYPDAVPCLTALKAAGYLVGVSGNQPPDVSERLVDSLGLDLDVVASSAAWGVEKPDPGFFTRLAVEAGMAAEEIAYVGDRVDNDVLPAKAAGMTAVFIRRGPWGYVHATWPEAAAADLRIDSLAELPAALRALSPPPTQDHE
jgi:FMN phosphatase YigB (HAD superfamily)